MIRTFLALSALLLGTAGFASAQDFQLTYNGSAGDTIDATLITTPVAGDPGEFTITGITDATLDGSAITLLAPNAFYNDNLLFDPGDPSYLDEDGVSFSTSGGFIDLYYYYYPTDTYQLLAQNGDDDITGTLTVTELATSPTPEPSSLLLLGTGLLGACGMLRRKLVA